LRLAAIDLRDQSLRGHLRDIHVLALGFGGRGEGLVDTTASGHDLLHDRVTLAKGFVLVRDRDPLHGANLLVRGFAELTFGQRGILLGDLCLENGDAESVDLPSLGERADDSGFVTGDDLIFHFI